MLINYFTEIDEQSILAFSLIKLQTTQPNPEPRTIGVQKEKSLRPRISAKRAKYRHQLHNLNHMNPSIPNPISCVTPSPPLSLRMLEDRSRSRQALIVFPSSQRNSMTVSIESARTTYYYCGNSLEASIKDQDPSCKKLHTCIKHKAHCGSNLFTFTQLWHLEDTWISLQSATP